MTPLHSFPEYTAAVRTQKDILKRFIMIGLSKKDSIELDELNQRIKAYEQSPTPPNIINHDKNVMK